MYSDYADARPALIDRIGMYCSYCERRISANLAVEHVLPKSLHPDLELEWSNFLLGCVNCNSTKGNREVDRNEILLPDQDNCFVAFEYDEMGRIGPAGNLSAGLNDKAERLLWLTGLDKLPDEFDDDALFEAAMERWRQRIDVWNLAQLQKTDLESENTEALRRATERLAVQAGFFSIWMKVFEDDHDMRLRFISVFSGTSLDCFDPSTTEPLARPGGHC